MKRIRVIIIMILVAQTSFAQHYLGFGASLSSPIQLDQSEAIKPLFGVGEGITLQYQYRYEHFLLSIGAAVSGEHPRVSVAEEKYAPHMIDTRGIPFVYLGALKNRCDWSSTLWIHTPVMVGFEMRPFYVMVGAQYSLSLVSSTHQTALMASAADYGDRYYTDYIDDMPTHGYHDFEPESTKGHIRYKNDIRLLVEAGGTFAIGKSAYGVDRLLRLGAFAEIGMLNVLDNSTAETKTKWDVSEYMHVTMNHVYSSADSDAGLLRNIVVGIRATWLFPIGEQPQKKIHHKKPNIHKNYDCRCFDYPTNSVF